MRSIQPNAAPSPITPAMFGVPASSRAGKGAYVLHPISTVVDHVAATLIRRHPLEPRFLPVQDPDAGGPVHLVRGADEEVAIERLHVHRHPRRRLRAIDEHRDAALVSRAQ